MSVFRQGWVALLVALLRHEPLPQGRFVPEPWPVVAAVGGRGPRACHGHAEGGMRERGGAAEAYGKKYALSIPYEKTSPLKGQGTWAVEKAV